MDGREKIISVVTETYGLSKADIVRHIRTKNIAEARQVVAFCLRVLENLSLSQIGNIIGGRDHTTVIHACRKIAAKIDGDAKFGAKMVEILDKITHGEPERPLDLSSGTSTAVKREVRAAASAEAPIELASPGKARVLELPTGDLSLSMREQKMFTEYKEGKTLQEIADGFRLTRERIRQIISKVVLKEAAAKVQSGFDIDVGEFFKGEKLHHAHNRRNFSPQVKADVRDGYLKKAETYSSVQNFARDVGIQTPKFERSFPEVVAVIRENMRQKKLRWSRLYVKCRNCGTVKIPHLRKGFCERCLGVYKNRRRDELLADSKCANCGTDRNGALRKYGRDLYITKKTGILCRGCFLQLTGGKLARSGRGRK